MKRAATKPAIRLPENGRATWRDSETPGLELVGNRAGASWYLRHRIDGKRVRDLIGRWPVLDLDGARSAARVKVQAAAVQAAAGTDLLAQRAERQQARQTRRNSITLAEALTLYGDTRVKDMRSGKHAVQTLRLVFGKLAPRLLVDLTRADLLAATEARARTAPATAATAIRYGKPFFRWIEETGRGKNLLEGVRTTQTAKRDRTLTLLELGKVLLALDAAENRTAATCALTLLATAGRLDEVSGLIRPELDLEARLWRLPAARNKSKREHLVPLNAEAIAAISAALAIGQGDLVFAGISGNTPFSGWSRFKERIDAASGVSGWTWHDARRTFASIMADRGIDPHIADRCLNHSGAGTLSGVARIYQRSELLDQRRHALDLWSDAMAEARTAAGGTARNVVPIGRRAR